MTRVGYAPGCFDLFHIGHLNLLRRAKEECDFLIAGVVSDEILTTHKGITPVVPRGCPAPALQCDMDRGHRGALERRVRGEICLTRDAAKLARYQGAFAKNWLALYRQIMR
jgi:cytidyltransferase-like protein